MTLSTGGKICGVLGVLGCGWFWLFWFVGPHIKEHPLIQLSTALGADMISIPLLVLRAACGRSGSMAWP